ncbi:hypothetical protein FRB97_009382 [Tulasnella sp. 331]|nr:hypothetical protein FRB97_009382 [Tulasnella sp. 331]
MSEHHSSDSDDELLENVDGDVLLGLPDGVVTEAVDLTNPTISRLGGAPKKDGSIRAFRSLRRNKEYALELKIQQATAIKSLRISEELAKNQKSLSANPFSRSAIPPVTGGSQPFGPGNIFQSSAVPTALTGQTKGDIESALFPIRSTTPALPEFDDMGDLVTTLASTKLFNKRNSLSWPTSPAYTPIYISTSSEYIVPEPKPHTEPSATPPESAADNWTPEAYESTAGDVIFQRFARRVSNEAQQCVRYVSIQQPFNLSHLTSDSNTGTNYLEFRYLFKRTAFMSGYSRASKRIQQPCLPALRPDLLASVDTTHNPFLLVHSADAHESLNASSCRIYSMY